MVAKGDVGSMELTTMRELLPPLPASEAQHLLKVAACIGRDANQVWAHLWAELRHHVTPSGQVLPGVREQGFEPACGWPAFLEQVWLLKHYLDSIERVCNTRTSSSVNPGTD